MKPTAFKVAGYMGILLIIVAATLLVINPKTENNLPAGFRTPIIAFEFFRTAEQINHFFEVEDISAYKQAMLTGNAIDYLFMFLYSGLVFCIALGIKKITRADSMYLTMFLCILMVVFDGLENYQIYQLVHLHGSENFSIQASWPLNLLNIFTWVKWSSIAGAFLLLSPFFLSGKAFHKTIGILSISSFGLCIAAFLQHGVLNEIFASNVVLVFLLLVVFVFTFRSSESRITQI